MPLRLECMNCGKMFNQWQTAEERLLSAIFSRKTLCKKCATEEFLEKCTECNRPIDVGLYFNGKPYCPEHLPYA